MNRHAPIAAAPRHDAHQHRSLTRGLAILAALVMSLAILAGHSSHAEDTAQAEDTAPVHTAQLAQTYAAMSRISQPLATQARDRATAAARRAGAGALATDDDRAFADNLADFARASARASLVVKMAGGPHDLGCIYAGMAADAERRLSDLHHAQSALAQARAYAGIADLLTDAVEVTPHRDAGEADPRAIAASRSLAASCAAAPIEAPAPF